MWKLCSCQMLWYNLWHVPHSLWRPDVLILVSSLVEMHLLLVARSWEVSRKGHLSLFIILAPAPVCVNRHLQINQHSSHLNFWFVFRCSSLLGRQCSWTTLLAQCGVKHCGSGQLQFFTMLTPESNGSWTVNNLWNDLNKSHEGPSCFAIGLFA